MYSIDMQTKAKYNVIGTNGTMMLTEDEANQVQQRGLKIQKVTEEGKSWSYNDNENFYSRLSKMGGDI